MVGCCRHSIEKRSKRFLTQLLQPLAYHYKNFNTPTMQFNHLHETGFKLKNPNVFFFSAEKYIYFHLTSVNSNSRLSNISITCQSVSAAREGYQRHYAVIQIYRQDHREVFAPSFVELDVSELAGIAASSGSLEDEVAENKSVNM